MYDVTFYLDFAFAGLGGGFLLSGIAWLVGLGYSLAINLIKTAGRG